MLEQSFLVWFVKQNERKETAQKENSEKKYVDFTVCFEWLKMKRKKTTIFYPLVWLDETGKK